LTRDNTFDIKFLRNFILLNISVGASLLLLVTSWKKIDKEIN